MSEFIVCTDGGAFDKVKEKKEWKGKFRAFSSFRFFDGEKELIHEDVKHSEDGTSPYAEIHAIANALENVASYVEAAKLKDFHVKLYTDSMLCHQSLTVWIFNWMRKAKKAKTKIFYSSKGTPVENQEQIKRAFLAMTNIRKSGKVSLFHINSHIAKKDVKKLKKEFEKFNKIKIADDEFLFIYLQNAKCDEMIKEAYDKFIENKRPKNNLLERLKEEI